MKWKILEGGKVRGWDGNYKQVICNCRGKGRTGGGVG